MPTVYAFDAYGTLFDIHSAVQRMPTRSGPDANRVSEIWRNKQLEYSWVRTLAGRYVDFWTITQQALDFALAAVPSPPLSVCGTICSTLTGRWIATAKWPMCCGSCKKRREDRNPVQWLPGYAGSGGNVNAGLDDLLDVSISVDAIRQFKTVPLPISLCAIPLVACQRTSRSSPPIGGTLRALRRLTGPACG